MVWYIFTGCIPITNIFHNNKTWHVEKYIYCNKKEVGGTTNDYIVIFYTYPTTLYLVYISSQIQRLCLTKKIPAKCFQNLSCFIYFLKKHQAKILNLFAETFAWTTESQIGRSEILNTELETLFSLTIFSFCLLQKCPWKPYHILFCDVSRKTRKITYFLCCQWEWMKKENTSISSSWLKILWYLKKIK